ncbi:BgTH12-00676 [Blumeria graminis f. sp. triticale]|uniref:BgTH12-00676 n=1 Tax=Blumeria graminis f. sp. triticale TaxID=1689686 RepID=A0A9W4DRH3_BLUGR|nr:BgTH12-00676 [Blumeria graminis f. sp. triticale]
MGGAIEALHIFDEHHRAILTHVYTSRPLSANQLLPFYTAYAQPRPNLIYLSTVSPPTLLFSIVHANLIFFLTSSSDLEPLLAIEFLHRVTDVLEEFVGSPLLAPKIESSYDVVAQLLNEMCDCGIISTSEPNALRDLVEVEGWMGKLLGNINIPTGLSASSNSAASTTPLSRSLPSNTTALPWRRTNVRHTSNELYVDIIETLTVTIAPSGRPIAAFSNGTIAFTSKISGVPDLLLNLSTLSGKQGISSVMELPVFHPCVRLARWKENPGEISFIPPDGKFVLAGYGVDLMPTESHTLGTANSSSLKLPINIDVKTGLGPTCSEFEVRLIINSLPGTGTSSGSGPSLRGGLTGNRAQSGFTGSISKSNTPLLEDLAITIPLPRNVRNISEIRTTIGETTYSPGGLTLEWHISAKEIIPGSATMRCTVSGPHTNDEEKIEGKGFHLDPSNYQEESYQTSSIDTTKDKGVSEQCTSWRKSLNKSLMPSSATVSFSVKGWLASGIKVESLNIDTRKSRGLSDGVKPYKGVKYLTVSTDGYEIRC